jgi:carbonic anhydrase
MRRALILVLGLLLCLPVAAQELSGDAIWKSLLSENLKYVGGELEYKDLDTLRKRLVDKQEPHVTVLSCADSRVPPELIFNRSIGDLFVVRAAGNLVDDAGLASIEFAIAKGWTRLIVVMGHENCGAVEAALEHGDPSTPSLLALVTRIRTSFIGIAWNGAKETPLDDATDANTRASAAWLTANSKVIRDAVTSGRVKIVPAYYSLKTGEVKAIE